VFELVFLVKLQLEINRKKIIIILLIAAS